MKYIFIFSLLLTVGFSFGQNEGKIDSLKNKLLSAKNIEHKVNIQYQISTQYLKSRELDSAKKHADHALVDSKHILNPILIADIYQNLGNIEYFKWNGPQAILYYQKVDSILSKNNIVNLTLLKSKSNIGNLIYRTDTDSLDILRIKKYFKEVLEISIKLKDTSQMSYAYIRFGDFYQNMKKYDSAVISYNQARKIIKDNYTASLANLYWALAEVYWNKGDNKKSRKFTFKRYDLVKNSKKISDMASANWVHGNLLFLLGDYKESIIHHDSSIILYERLNYKNFGRLAGAAGRIYESYENLGNYEKAFNYLKKTMIYNDSALLRTNSNKVYEVETKYQTEKKEQEIVLLKSQNELALQQKKNQRNQLLGGIGITSIAGLFFFFLYRNRQKTNQKLQELDKAKSNFFANISHEFRTPLTLISGPIQSQLKKENLPDDERHNFEVMHRNSTRLLSLVDQLLDISKIEAGNFKLKVSKSELMPFLGSLCDSFTFEADRRKINYNIYADETKSDTYFDKDIIEKIVVNLVSNALKYTQDKGSIVCNATVKDNQVYFMIKNTGKGLTKDEISNIFKRFYQLNENSQGVGIGLALVKDLVALHKGQLTVESTPNQWTNFKFSLPIDKASFSTNEIVDKIEIDKVKAFSQITSETTIISKPHSEDEIDENSEAPILLVVDDNVDVRTYVSNLFKDHYTILNAKDGQEGIDLAIEHVPDIIISDIMMPVKNGIYLCNTVKADERTSHIPIILLTAKAGEENEIEGIKTGADDYITKPFNEELLQLRVEKLIESRKKLQERYSQEVILRPKDIAITPIDEQFLEKVQTVLEDKLVESSFSIEDFSKAVGMSRMQLHRKIKALTGLSASEFIRSQRLKLAAQLLKKSDINVSQVGYTVGFNVHSYFTKCFKEVYNCTPSEYAKNTLK